MAIKVTMGLTERDIENANSIYSFTNARTKAQAVSIALSLTKYLIDQKRKENDLLLGDRFGRQQRIVMTELENLNDEAAAAAKLQKITG